MKAKKTEAVKEAKLKDERVWVHFDGWSWCVNHKCQHHSQRRRDWIKVFKRLMGIKS